MYNVVVHVYPILTLFLYTLFLQAQSSMFSVGQVIQATVKELMSFGIVMELAPDVSGLLHIRNLDHAYVSQLHWPPCICTCMYLFTTLVFLSDKFEG